MNSASLRKKTQLPNYNNTLIDSDTEEIPNSIQKHRNLNWLHMEMEKLSVDVIDREICKRLRQFSGQLDYDLPSDIIKQIKNNSTVDTDKIPEGLLPFYRHYNFMFGRKSKAVLKN